MYTEVLKLLEMISQTKDASIYLLELLTTKNIT